MHPLLDQVDAWTGEEIATLAENRPRDKFLSFAATRRPVTYSDIHFQNRIGDESNINPSRVYFYIIFCGLIYSPDEGRGGQVEDRGRAEDRRLQRSPSLVLGGAAPAALPGIQIGRAHV